MGCNAGMLSEIHTKADRHCQVERLLCWRYGIICHKSSLILSLSYHFTTDNDRVLLQLVHILNTLFKYWVSYRQLTCMNNSLIILTVHCIPQQATIIGRLTSAHPILLPRTRTTSYWSWSNLLPTQVKTTLPSFIYYRFFKLLVFCGFILFVWHL